MSRTYSVAVLVGSLRAESITRKLAKALIGRAPASLSCAIVPVDMPLYNEDLDGDVPPAWAAFREALQASDAVLFASPEYNRSVPGVLKNAIDVGSRPYGRGALLGKPAAVFTHAPGPLGATLANHAIRQSLVFLNMPTLPQPEIYLPRSKTVLGADGELEGEDAVKLFTSFMAAFGAWIERFAGK